jgi:hypothetical protein
MNFRLLTPAIVLVSFGAALGLTGWHTPSAPLPVAVPSAVTAVASAPAAPPAADTSVPAPATVLLPQAAPAPLVTEDAQPADEDAAPAGVQSQTLAQESAGFLDARDRAAERGARSH